ncbi:YncE family protein [Acetivibrio cellulolyticus]|uniref:YncE family protein n=1 Tax=Acetivibrio cellulolyticus TaxID=35830 RepID=UPI0001E2EB91|nr:beta-propeller fold lactonase family protein [Acetivibrio cellulolyticus]
MNIISTLAYVSNANKVSVIDTGTNTVIDTVVADAYPTGIAITPNGNFVYVINNVTNDVTVINTCDNTIIANVRVGEFPIAVAITPNGKFAYVANTFSNTVSVINTITLEIVATIRVGNFPEGVEISCDINNATSGCIESSNLSCNCKICCTVKVAGVVKAKKLVQIEVPVLRNCESKQCCPYEGIPVAPGKSYPLPIEPSEVSKIKFAARTNPGMTSRFTAFLNVIPYTFTTVTEELKPFEINLPGNPYPIENISLKNLGKSTIYVYKLTTE